MNARIEIFLIMNYYSLELIKIIQFNNLKDFQMTAWINMIDDDQASSDLNKAFDLARSPAGTVDNVMRIHSLRPHTMIGHIELYKSVLHNENNTLPMWLAETIGSYVAVLNECEYSYTNHWANASHLINNATRAEQIETALKNDQPEKAFTGMELEMMRYARKLTLTPAQVSAEDIKRMRKDGAGDGEILEVNQVVSYFCYVHRLLNGLGVTLSGDVIGYYGHND